MTCVLTFLEVLYDKFANEKKMNSIKKETKAAAESHQKPIPKNKQKSILRKSKLGKSKKITVISSVLKKGSASSTSRNKTTEF